MTPDQFWHGDVWLAEVYRETYKMKLEEQNHIAWLSGLYAYNAMATVATKLTSKRKAEYLKAPVELFPEKREEGEEANHEAVFKMLEAMMLASGGANGK